MTGDEWFAARKAGRYDRDAEAMCHIPNQRGCRAPLPHRAQGAGLIECSDGWEVYVYERHFTPEAARALRDKLSEWLGEGGAR